MVVALGLRSQFCEVCSLRPFKFERMPWINPEDLYGAGYLTVKMVNETIRLSVNILSKSVSAAAAADILCDPAGKSL